jgi:hypothetical protein
MTTTDYNLIAALAFATIYYLVSCFYPARQPQKKAKVISFKVKPYRRCS